MSVKPLSPFVFDETFVVDQRKILLCVFLESNGSIAVYMPQRVSEGMSDRFAVDVLAAVKDFLENVPRGKVAVL